MDRTETLLRRVRLVTGFFILALVLSGATAIPLESELDWLVRNRGAEQSDSSPGRANPSDASFWLLKVRHALRDTNSKYPFMAYGTDWLAFGHFVIAIAFVGAVRDPVRNVWLFEFGLIACALVVPYALIFGGLRGIPIYWRLVDSSFGVLGAIPLWLGRQWTLELEAAKERSHQPIIAQHEPDQAR